MPNQTPRKHRPRIARAGLSDRIPVAFRLPEKLIARIDRVAERDGVTRTWKVEQLLQRALSRNKIDDTQPEPEMHDDRQIDLFA